MPKMIRHTRRNQSSRTKSRYRSSSSSLTWVWILVGILIGICSAVGTYTFINNAQDKRQAQAKSSIHSSHPKTFAEKSNRASPKKEKNNAQRFEFYTLLPGMEIQLPDKNLPNSSAPQPTLKTSQPINTVHQTSQPKTSQSNPPHSAHNTQNLSHDSQPNRETLNMSEHTQQKINDQKVDIKDKKSMATAQFIVQAGIFQGLNQADELKAKLTLQGFNTRIQKVKTEEGQTWFRVTLGPFATEDQALKQKKHLEDQKIHGILILQRPNT